MDCHGLPFTSPRKLIKRMERREITEPDGSKYATTGLLEEEVAPRWGGEEGVGRKTTGKEVKNGSLFSY